MTSWSETDLLTADREVAAIERAADERVENARAYAEWALRNGRTDLDGAQAWVATVAARATAARDEALAGLAARRTPAATTTASALTVVPTPADDDCISGSCQLARPDGPCDCACGGNQHGAKSTLAPAACAGTQVLAEVDPRGGYRYPRCPGCTDCRRPRLVLV